MHGGMASENAGMLARRLVDLYFKSGLNARILNAEVTLPSDFDLGTLSQRLLDGEPVQYVAGGTWFAELWMQCQKPVLIPRPETEELAYMVARHYLDEESESFRGLDLCTGSGCLGIGIAHLMEMRSGQWAGCDVSAIALELAKKNAEFNQLHFHVFGVDVLKDFELNGYFDCWVSNPPYIPINERGSVEKVVMDWEDPIALFTPDDDALVFYNSIAKAGLKHLKTKGTLWFECFHLNTPEVKAALEKHGYSEVEIIKDYKGAARFVKAIRP